MRVGDRYEYEGNFYHYIGEIMVKVRYEVRGEPVSDWVTHIEYYNSSGRYAREKDEFFERFKPC